MRTGLGIILIAALMAAPPAYAEFYKYVDENGNIRFTDDITMVPREQREKLREYQDYADDAEAAPETSKTPATAPPAETPEPDRAPVSDEDLIAQGKRLEAERAALDTEYNALMEARRILEERSGEFRTKGSRKEYETQVIQLNERNAAYEAKRAAYDNEVLEYNAKLDQLREASE